jgi:hypothetical protein
MRQISSHTTFYYKRVFPVVWFGFVLLFLVFAYFGRAKSGGAGMLPFFIVPILMLVFGYVLMNKLIFDLVDEVLDAGDALVIKNKGQQERTALANIINVNYSPFMNPPRVTLSLRRPSIFGDQVTFCAPIRIMPFATSPVIDELIRRVDAARGA